MCDGSSHGVFGDERWRESENVVNFSCGIMRRSESYFCYGTAMGLVRVMNEVCECVSERMSERWSTKAFMRRGGGSHVHGGGQGR